MEDYKLLDLNDPWTLSTFKSLNEVLIMQGICATAKGEFLWDHNEVNRQIIRDNVAISEIGFKVILRELIRRGHLNKLRKGRYSISPQLKRQEQ